MSDLSHSQIDYPGRLGRFVETTVAGEKARAFLPPRLPPEPRIDLGPLLPLLGHADRSLGRLDGLTQLLPDPHIFLYAYVRKEALLSSQIEGTQSTLTDLFALEAGEDVASRFDDVREVSNYVAAMQHGLERLASLPLSLRLIRELHERLLRDGRGATKQPGEFRTTQNWIGGTRPGNAMFVPPPPHEVAPARVSRILRILPALLMCNSRQSTLFSMAMAAWDDC